MFVHFFKSQFIGIGSDRKSERDVIKYIHTFYLPWYLIVIRHQKYTGLPRNVLNGISLSSILKRYYSETLHVFKSTNCKNNECKPLLHAFSSDPSEQSALSSHIHVRGIHSPGLPRHVNSSASHGSTSANPIHAHAKCDANRHDKHNVTLSSFYPFVASAFVFNCTPREAFE